ncbi:MAG TPA: hypothetical protein VJN18_35445 [Polyangiaceae bacterium]|nr:hypothetical protein [Polyangiaceae bacterium]
MTRTLIVALLLAAPTAWGDEGKQPPAGARVAWNLVVSGPPGTAQQHYQPAAHKEVPVATPAPWQCLILSISTSRGSETGTQLSTIRCTAGEAQVSATVSCAYSLKQTHPGQKERIWKPTDAGGFTLARAGEKDGLNLRLSCLVDTRFTLD